MYRLGLSEFKRLLEYPKYKDKLNKGKKEPLLNKYIIKGADDEDAKANLEDILWTFHRFGLSEYILDFAFYIIIFQKDLAQVYGQIFEKIQFNEKLNYRELVNYYFSTILGEILERKDDLFYCVSFDYDLNFFFTSTEEQAKSVLACKNEGNFIYERYKDFYITKDRVDADLEKDLSDFDLFEQADYLSRDTYLTCFNLESSWTFERKMEILYGYEFSNPVSNADIDNLINLAGNKHNNIFSVPGMLIGLNKQFKDRFIPPKLVLNSQGTDVVGYEEYDVSHYKLDQDQYFYFYERIFAIINSMDLRLDSPYDNAILKFVVDDYIINMMDGLRNFLGGDYDLAASIDKGELLDICLGKKFIQEYEKKYEKIKQYKNFASQLGNYVIRNSKNLYLFLNEVEEEQFFNMVLSMNYFCGNDICVILVEINDNLPNNYKYSSFFSIFVAWGIKSSHDINYCRRLYYAYNDLIDKHEIYKNKISYFQIRMINTIKSQMDYAIDNGINLDNIDNNKYEERLDSLLLSIEENSILTFNEFEELKTIFNMFFHEKFLIPALYDEQFAEKEEEARKTLNDYNNKVVIDIGVHQIDSKIFNDYFWITNYIYAVEDYYYHQEIISTKKKVSIYLDNHINELEDIKLEELYEQVNELKDTFANDENHEEIITLIDKKTERVKRAMLLSSMDRNSIRNNILDMEQEFLKGINRQEIGSLLNKLEKDVPERDRKNIANLVLDNLITSEIIFKHLNSRSDKKDLEFSTAVLPLTKALELVVNYINSRVNYRLGDNHFNTYYNSYTKKHKNITLGNFIYMIKEHDDYQYNHRTLNIDPGVYNKNYILKTTNLTTEVIDFTRLKLLNKKDIVISSRFKYRDSNEELVIKLKNNIRFNRMAFLLAMANITDNYRNVVGHKDRLEIQKAENAKKIIIESYNLLWILLLLIR